MTVFVGLIAFLLGELEAFSQDRLLLLLRVTAHPAPTPQNPWEKNLPL